jgi:hypothetical protein
MSNTYEWISSYIVHTFHLAHLGKVSTFGITPYKNRGKVLTFPTFLEGNPHFCHKFLFFLPLAQIAQPGTLGYSLQLSL